MLLQQTRRSAFKQCIKMVESSKQLEMSSYQLEQISPQIKRFISFVNSHKKPTSEQVENFNEKATQFMKELNKISDTVRQIEQDKDTTNRNPKLESLRNQLLAKVSTLTDKLNKLCKKIGVIDCKSLPVNEKTTKQDSKPQDPESTLSNTTDGTATTTTNTNITAKNLSEENEEVVSKKNKVKKSKDELKSTKTKKLKGKEVSDSKDGITVVAQVHATENDNEYDENVIDDSTSNANAKDGGKSSRKLKPSKRLIKSDKPNKLKKVNDESLLDAKQPLKQQDGKGNSETIGEEEELEVEDEEAEEYDINQVEPFQRDGSEVGGENETEASVNSHKIAQSNIEIKQVASSLIPIKPNTTEESSIFYRTVRQWIGDDEDDLSFKSGETLKVIEKDDDGWWLAENIQGQQGLIPMNFLKEIDFSELEWQKIKLEYEKQKESSRNSTTQAEDSPQTYSDADDDDANNDQHVNEDKFQEKKDIGVHGIPEANSVNQISTETQESVEYVEVWEHDEDEVEEEESEIKSDVEQEEGENEDYSIEDDDEDDDYEKSVGDRLGTLSSDTNRNSRISHFGGTEKGSFQSGNDLSGWYIKNSEKALKAYQPLPSSVRLGFLSLPGLKSHNYQKFLSPKLGSSHLIFTDLLLDVDGKKITRRQPCWQKIITIQKISQLSLLEESSILSILNCLIRLCLFDGVKPISNIVYLPITSTDRERKTWTVTPHNIRKSERAYEVSSDLFVRYNEQNMHVCLLIEVAIVVSKQNTNKIIELSLGWVTIPLYDENGQIISNKTCEYPLQDTLPFETRKADKLSPKDVSLKTRMQNLLFNKTALLTIRFSQPNKEQQDKLDSLPDVLIGLMSYVPFMSYHRDFLASIFPGFRGSNEKDRFILRHVPPEVALFPVVADCPLLIESLRVSWQDRLKEIPANKKKDIEYLKKIYSDYFRRVLYPLLWLQDMHFPNIMTSQQFELTSNA
ncbi:unnamed protein product [Heterobilharzia americana]|nr:unnamed protein product [Heterobilharzia americana]